MFHHPNFTSPIKINKALKLEIVAFLRRDRGVEYALCKTLHQTRGGGTTGGQGETATGIESAQTFLQSNREERVAESLLWRVLRAGGIIYGGGCH